MMKERNLSIGIQDFEKLRSLGHVYIDKTALIWKLIRTSNPYFLSRPRRFGKSLLLSTIKSYFLAQKELFKDLAIEKLENNLKEPWQKHPVLYLDLNSKNYKDTDALVTILNRSLSEWEECYSWQKKNDIPEERFYDIIKGLYEKTGKQVVVLVDEYDKPLLQTQGVNPALNEEYRAMLKGFYGVLKSSDPYLRFVLLTGVSQFSRLSIFSDMNQFINITTDDAYAEICGITEEELKANLKPELENFASKNSLSMEETLEALRKQYDGYRFSETGKKLYNPFSLLESLRTGKLGNYWYETGTPTFLVNLIKRETFDVRALEKTEGMSLSTLRNSEPNPLNPIPILFQTGYLTLKEYDKEFDEFTLGFPNKEVCHAFLKDLLPNYLGREEGASFFITKFVKDIKKGMVEDFMSRIQAIIATLPYSQEKKTNLELRERDYQIAIYLNFTLMGQYCRTEVHSIKGRADCIVELGDTVYIFEFKLISAGTPKDALRQIKEQGYAEPYKASDKEVVLVGASFDEGKRNIGSWEAEYLQ